MMVEENEGPIPTCGGGVSCSALFRFSLARLADLRPAEVTLLPGTKAYQVDVAMRRTGQHSLNAPVGACWSLRLAAMCLSDDDAHVGLKLRPAVEAFPRDHLADGHIGVVLCIPLLNVADVQMHDRTTDGALRVGHGF